MSANKFFGTKIKFSESFISLSYLKKEVTEKLYDDSAFEKSMPILGLNGRYKYPSGYRKLIFFKHEPMEGIIIGQTKKIEGWYTPGYGGSPEFGREDAEPPMFDTKKAYRFWVVATSLNKTYLVEKG